MDARQEAPQRSADDGSPAADGRRRLIAYDVSGVGLPEAENEQGQSWYACPVCGKEDLRVTFGCVRNGPAAPQWWFMCESDGSALRELAEHLEVATAALLGTTWEQLDAWLGEPVRRNGRRSGVRPVMPPESEQLARYRAAFQSSIRLRRRLYLDRGLTKATTRAAEIGWDDVRHGFVLPIRDERGDVVNVSWRARKGRTLYLQHTSRLSKYRLPGQAVESGGLPLYPFPLPDAGEPWWLLVEGEWDALIARQEGLPAFTGLLGKQWNTGWDRHIVGRSIAVAYDVGAEGAAATTVGRLMAGGAKAAWIVPLGLAKHGDDLTDWFVTYHRTATDLRRLVRESARKARVR